MRLYALCETCSSNDPEDFVHQREGNTFLQCHINSQSHRRTCNVIWSWDWYQQDKSHATAEDVTGNIWQRSWAQSRVLWIASQECGREFKISCSPLGEEEATLKLAVAVNRHNCVHVCSEDPNLHVEYTVDLPVPAEVRCVIQDYRETVLIWKDTHWVSVPQSAWGTHCAGHSTIIWGQNLLPTPQRTWHFHRDASYSLEHIFPERWSYRMQSFSMWYLRFSHRCCWRLKLSVTLRHIGC
jgi:hypothetical protein